MPGARDQIGAGGRNMIKDVALCSAHLNYHGSPANFDPATEDDDEDGPEDTVAEGEDGF